MLVARPRKTARRQGIQRRRPAQSDEPRARHGEHVREGGRGQRLGAEAADNEHRDGLERVLQGVCDDDRDGVSGEEPYLREPEAEVRDGERLRKVAYAFVCGVGMDRLGLGQQAGSLVGRRRTGRPRGGTAWHGEWVALGYPACESRKAGV